MKRFNRYYILPALALLLLGAVLGVQLDSYLSDTDTFAELQKLRKAFVTINSNYVDPVDSEAIAEQGIQGMLDELDPHSSYIKKKDVQRVQESYEGSFGGIGIMFEMVEDTARVITPIADGPSDKVGVMSGDRIVEIEDSTAVGLDSRGIQERLKGPVDTEVQMTVYRPGMSRRYTFTITRDEIPLYSINTAYMVDDQTGYIEIDRFAMTTHDEFMEKLRMLKGEGMERLVLDLRGNHGGVMRSAIEIVDELLGAGLPILKTRGRRANMNNEYRASSGGAFEEQPVIVLVDRQSASASEIVTGALQDHDRALVVGQRTFGKALVQKQFELTDGSLLQMTVGRYYTPAGRLIQTPYDDGSQEDYYEQKFASMRKATFDLDAYKETIPDSLSYQTNHGRTVYGGGGILPDVVVKPDTLSIRRFIAGSGLDLAFTTQWFPKHEQEVRNQWNEREDAFLDEYEVPQAMVDSFWTYASRNGMELTTNPDSAAPANGVFLRAEAEQARPYVATRLKALLARQLYGSSAMRPVLNQVDPAFQQAISLWGDANSLAAYHASSESTVTGQGASGGSMNNN